MRQPRPLRPFERGAHLDILEHELDNARQNVQHVALEHVRRIAAQAAKAKDSAAFPTTDDELARALCQEFQRLRALGQATVTSELHHQRLGQALPIGLSRDNRRLLDTGGNAGRKPGKRGRLAAHAIVSAIWQAVRRRKMGHDGGSIADFTSAGETAGDAAARQVALSHSNGALANGRTAAARRDNNVVGARYTAILDQNTCASCALADDGVLRALDDPVRLARQPPNPACHGGDRCRCIEVFQLAAENTLVPA